ncbi:phosphoglycerate dehydrogenase [Salisaeta longa]|uniref:phosphoglycerate dehydrogenase n=1 Tax=Salisaeta longa TaxID=503170 RepID=UPI0003B6409E|nr:phosphoglycerate dehydrogenase [Salisaeta longa]
MTVLVADNIANVGIEALQDASHRVVEEPSLAGDALVEALRTHTPDALIVRSTKVTPEALDASPPLALIVRAGAGYDTIDVQGASARGIFVANCPGKNSVAVAELTLGLIAALDRRIPDNVADARAGHWNKKAYAQAEGLKGRTLGIVGLGNIGDAVAQRAKAFDLDVIAWSRSLTPEDAAAQGIGYRASPAAVAADASIVTLHVASTPETKHLADRSFFEALPAGAIFINTTRAAVVDEDALAWALEAKDLRAGLDVMSGEPSHKEGAFSHPLADHPHVYMTHHIGASTQQAQDATALEAARVVNTFEETSEVPNCVNLAHQTPAVYQMTVRHKDKVGVLAGVLDEMRRAEWNIQEMENRIFEGAQAAVASLRFDGAMDQDCLARIEERDDVFAVSLVEL